jgi:hypothetical protein
VVWVDHDSGADDAVWRAVDTLWISWGFLKSDRGKEPKGQIFHVILIAAAMLAQNPASRTFVQGRISSERERGSDSAQLVCEAGTGLCVSTDSSVLKWFEVKVNMWSKNTMSDNVWSIQRAARDVASQPAAGQESAFGHHTARDVGDAPAGGWCRSREVAGWWAGGGCHGVPAQDGSPVARSCNVSL